MARLARAIQGYKHGRWLPWMARTQSGAMTKPLVIFPARQTPDSQTPACRR